MKLTRWMGAASKWKEWHPGGNGFQSTFCPGSKSVMRSKGSSFGLFSESFLPSIYYYWDDFYEVQCE